jgi:hypothetical protein
MFVLTIATNHDGPTAHVDTPTHRKTSLHWIAQWSVVGIIDEFEKFADSMTDRIIAIRAD